MTNNHSYLCLDEDEPRIPFPSQVIFKNVEQEVLYADLVKTKEYYNPLTVDFKALRTTGIEGDFMDFINGSASGCLLTDSSVTKPLVMEFLSSFSCVRNSTDNSVIGWSFRIGNTDCFYRLQDLSLLFGFPLNSIAPSYTEEELDLFWTQISGMDLYEQDMSPKCISGGVWKYIHRIIVHYVNTRSDLGRVVTRRDLELMFAMAKGERINYADVLGTRFEEWKNLASKDRSVGGAIFIHEIAVKEGFNVDLYKAVCRPLDTAFLISGRMLRADRQSWVHNPKLGKKSAEKLRRRSKTESGEGSSRGKRAKIWWFEEVRKIEESQEEGLTRIENAITELSNRLTQHIEKVNKMEESNEGRWTRIENAITELSTRVAQHVQESRAIQEEQKKIAEELAYPKFF